MLTIQLDSIRKYRNDAEFRMVNRASCGGFEVVCDGSNIKALCQRLIDAGHAPDDLVEVKRGDMPIFSATTLSKWASGKAQSGSQPEHLRRINSSG